MFTVDAIDCMKTWMSWQLNYLTAMIDESNQRKTERDNETNTGKRPRQSKSKTDRAAFAAASS